MRYKLQSMGLVDYTLSYSNGAVGNASDSLLQRRELRRLPVMSSEVKFEL